MRISSFLPAAAILFGAVLAVGDAPARGAQPLSTEQTLKWARETIDTHAVTRHMEPPGRMSGTKWEVVRIAGCAVELKETDHRESADSVVTGEGVFDFQEDKVVTWKFDLAALRPRFIVADTSIGMPHIKIFAEGDAFHLQTDTVSRSVGKDGTVHQATSWSAPGNARNLFMFFDSPAADNKVIVRRLETDLRDAAYQCSAQAKAH